jgi:hypothetical protein
MAIVNSDLGPIYKCDAPECKAMRFVESGELPEDGFVGGEVTSILPSGANGPEVLQAKRWFACRGAHIKPAVTNVLAAVHAQQVVKKASDD